MENTTGNKIGVNLLMINAFVYISFSLYAPFLSSYYSKAGITAVQIGVLLTIGPVIAILIQPLWAILSDKTGRRKDILSLVVLGSGISMFSYYIGRSFLTFFIATVLLSIFATSIVPLSDAITIRSAAKYRLDFAKIRMGGTIGFAIVVVLAGALIKQNPSIQFTLGFIGYMILFLFIRGLPKDERLETSITDVNPIQKLKRKERLGFLSIFESKQIIFVLAFAFISQVGLSFTYSFLGVYMVNLGLSEGTIGLINCVAAFSELPVLFLINRVLKKVSTMKIIIISCILVGIRIFTVTGGNIGYIILSQAMHGLSFMTMYYSCAVFISIHVKPENQSQGQSTLAIVQSGIGSIVGNIAGGFLVDYFGLKLAYLYMATIVIAISGIIFTVQLIYHKKMKSKMI